MADVQSWNPTDSSNTDLFPEGMPFSGVNDGGRAVQGAIARWFRDTNGSIDASGSSNAFAITSNRTIAGLVDDLMMAFTANHTITGAATLNLNGLGAKSIKRFNGGDLTAGDIVSGLPVVVVYKLASDTWYMVSAAAALFANMHADFNENASPGNPAVNTVRLYASDESGVTHLHYRRDSGSVVRLRTATQAEMEAASTQETFSTPGRQHFHPGHPKAHGRVNSDGTLQTGSYGIASAAKTGTGEYTVTLSTAINDPTVKAGPREGQRVVFGSPSSSTVMAVSSRNSNNATAQDSSFWIEVAGDH